MLFFRSFLLFFCLSILPLGQVFASCGACACLLDSTALQTRKKGQLLLDYSYQYLDQSQIFVGTRKGNVGEISGHHNEIYTLTQIHTLRASLGVNDKFSIETALPFINRQHQHVHNHHGASLLSDYNVQGLGDIELVSRLNALQTENAQIALKAGVKFPTGKSNSRGTEDVAGGSSASVLAESATQPGTRSFDLILGISFTRQLYFNNKNVQFFVDVNSRINGKGSDDYRLGNKLLGSVGAVYPVFKKLALSLQSDIDYAQKDDPGQTTEEVQKTGFTKLYVTPGFELELSDRTRLYSRVQLPVYQNVHLIQPVSEYNLLLGVSTRFDVR